MSGSNQAVRIEPSARVSARTRQHFAPTAIQGLEVLALPSAKLDAYVANLVEQNPLLDYDYEHASLRFEEMPSEEDLTHDEREPFEDAYVRKSVPLSLREARTFDLERLRDEHSETETLQSHVRMQIPASEFCGAQGRALNAIIESLDDDGYFSGNLPALCADAEIEISEGEELLRFVQRLAPSGVGARNLAECLLLQVRDDMPHVDVMRTMIAESLDDLAENRTTKLVRTYHVSLEELDAIRKAICTMNPRPGAMFSQRKDTTYVIPDLVISRHAKDFSVRVTGELCETVVINQAYCDLAKSNRISGQEASWIQSKRAEAEAVLANISQRQQTLYRFGTYLVEVQYDFFCSGEDRIRPLTMQQAADALGVHVSTISRTVQDKYVLTPWGVYPLKYFFSTAVTCVTDERRNVLSALAVKSRIKELVAHEDCHKPLSDASITTILNGEGIEIKRRTVAKYREVMGIRKQSQRRR